MVHQIQKMSEIQVLRSQLESTDDFIERMEIQGKIDDLEIKSGEKIPPKPLDSPYMCEGCSG